MYAPLLPRTQSRWRNSPAPLIGVILFCSLIFSTYIIIMFFARPPTDWKTVSDLSSPTAYWPMMVHWLTGIADLLLGPLQLLPRREKFHRWNGRIFCACCAVSSAAGLTFVFTHETIGGMWMNVAFGVYGGLLATCACLTVLKARSRSFEHHELLGICTLSLALSSVLYRIYRMPLVFFDSETSRTFTKTYLCASAWLMFFPNLPCIWIFIRRRQMQRPLVQLEKEETAAL